MKYNKTIALAGLTVAMSAMVACSDADMPQAPGLNDAPEYAPAQPEEADMSADGIYRSPVYISGGVSAEAAASLAEAMPVRSAMQGAAVAVMTADEAEADRHAVDEVLAGGGVVAVIDPDVSSVGRLSELYGVNFGATDRDVKVMAFGADASYVLYDGCSVDEPYRALTDWLNRRSLSNRRKSRASTQISPYNIAVDFPAPFMTEACDYYVSIEYDLTPMYVSQKSNQSKSGDYYIVSGKVTSHNGLIKGRKWRGMSITYDLVDADGNPLSGVHFPAGGSPQPESFSAGVTYSSGFTFGINGLATVGWMGSKMFGGGLDFNFTWSSSQEWVLPDIKGMLNTTPGTGRVNYVYEQTRDDALISHNDATVANGWVWHVPSPTVKDDDKQGYYMAMNIVAFTDRGNVEFTKRPFKLKLCVPDRQRYGMIAMGNPSLLWINHVKVWNAGEYGNPDARPVKTDNDAYEQDTTCRLVLPEGTYTLTYDLYEPDGLTLRGHYKIENLVVKMCGGKGGDDFESSTTKANILNGVEVK